MDTKKIIRVIKEHIWGPVGSVIFHILLLIVLLKVATAVTQQPQAEFTLNVMDIKPMQNVEQIKQEVEKDPQGRGRPRSARQDRAAGCQRSQHLVG